jgi:hypothetical protein
MHSAQTPRAVSHTSPVHCRDDVHGTSRTHDDATQESPAPTQLPRVRQATHTPRS